MRILLAALLLAVSGLAAVAQDGDTATHTALGFVSGPAMTSSYLAPDGTKLLYVKGSDFCLYSAEGEELACANIEEQAGVRVRIDNESPVWSPDSRYVAFTQPTFQMLTDSDLWLFDAETLTFINLTDDNYVGRVSFGEPDNGVSTESIHIDLTPAWHPDGRLTFVRYPYAFVSTSLSVWAIDVAGGEPEPLFELLPSNPYRYFIMSLDWSRDGLTAAYTVDAQKEPITGVWVYETERGRARPVYYPTKDNPYIVSATISPDGTQLLVTTGLLLQYQPLTQPHEQYGSGIFVVSLDDLTVRVLHSEGLIAGSGWMPDGALLYTAYFPWEPALGGLFVTDDAEAEGQRIFAFATDTERPMLRLAAPTSMQRQPLRLAADGRLLLAADTADTYLLQLNIE